jgi:hypothetical protein
MGVGPFLSDSRGSHELWIHARIDVGQRVKNSMVPVMMDHPNGSWSTEEIAVNETGIWGVNLSRGHGAGEGRCNEGNDEKESGGLLHIQRTAKCMPVVLKIAEESDFYRPNLARNSAPTITPSAAAEGLCPHPHPTRF